MTRRSRNGLLLILLAASVLTPAAAAPPPTEPWRGVHAGPNARTLPLWFKAIPELAEIGVNVITFQVDYNLEYSSHPELRSDNPITKTQASQVAKTCRMHGIRPIPMFQCLGHQSWQKNTSILLKRYPEFDETPGAYPDNEGIYCRSWCPLHPEVNPIIFELMDELINAFGADAFHVGMDEVFLIGEDQCPRCRGKNKAELFAKAVNDYHRHLVGKRGVEMLMWGDRLLDAEVTGYDEWEASTNGTHPAVDLIPKDVIILDWHYDKRAAYPSIPFFLEKGFRVVPAGWKSVEATEALIGYAQSHKTERLLGHHCTIWGKATVGEISRFPPVLAAMRKLGGLKTALNQLTDQEKAEVYELLFDGKSIEGWVIMGSPAGWTVRDGVILSEGGKDGNWLRSKQQYGDFTLRLEWRVSKNGNSGVFIRCPAEGDPWITGHEVQITNEPRDDAHCTGSLYGTVAVKPRPDESHGVWHTYEIRCLGKRITVVADGVVCVDADMDEVEAIRNKPLTGYIGLQDSHTGPGGTIEYRNIRIKPVRR